MQDKINKWLRTIAAIIFILFGCWNLFRGYRGDVTTDRHHLPVTPKDFTDAGAVYVCMGLLVGVWGWWPRKPKADSK